MGKCRSHLIRLRYECLPLFPGAANYPTSAGDHSSSTKTRCMVRESSQYSLTGVSRVCCTARAGMSPAAHPRPHTQSTAQTLSTLLVLLQQFTRSPKPYSPMQTPVALSAVENIQIIPFILTVGWGCFYKSLTH